jgi:hypothetical protein
MSKGRTATRTKLSLAETREFLADVSKHPRLVDDLGDLALDDKEVARYIARKAKTLFLVASHSNLERVQKLAELLFYAAYLHGRAKPQEAIPDTIDWEELFDQPAGLAGRSKEEIIQ